LSVPLDSEAKASRGGPKAETGGDTVSAIATVRDIASHAAALEGRTVRVTGELMSKRPMSGQGEIRPFVDTLISPADGTIFLAGSQHLAVDGLPDGVRAALDGNVFGADRAGPVVLEGTVHVAKGASRWGDDVVHLRVTNVIQPSAGARLADGSPGWGLAPPGLLDDDTYRRNMMGYGERSGDGRHTDAEHPLR
jgi:hypothetical protein